MVPQLCRFEALFNSSTLSMPICACVPCLQVPRGASKSKPLRYEVSQRELEEMMREQG